MRRHDFVPLTDQRNAGGAGGNAQAATCRSHSYTEPGENTWSSRWNGSTRSRSTAYPPRSGATAASRETVDDVHATSVGGLTVGDVEPDAVSGWRLAGQKSADRPVIAPDARVDEATIRAAIPYLSRMTSKNRGVATGIDRELNPHVIGPITPPPQLTEPTRLNLSRWRHGFEPRWDYTEQPRSEACSA